MQPSTWIVEFLAHLFPTLCLPKILPSLETNAQNKKIIHNKTKIVIEN
jgi:hypothetical protein